MAECSYVFTYNLDLRSKRLPSIPLAAHVLAEAGDDAQTVECQVECARLLSSIAGRSSSLLLSGGALGTLEDMLERLGAEQRFAHVPTP